MAHKGIAHARKTEVQKTRYVKKPAPETKIGDEDIYLSIARRIRQGYTNQEIARDLAQREETVTAVRMYLIEYPRFGLPSSGEELMRVPVTGSAFIPPLTRAQLMARR